MGCVMNAKRFDCVEMKNAIQKRLFAERKGMRPEQIIREMHIVLETSNSPAARFWRAIDGGKSMSSARSRRKTVTV